MSNARAQRRRDQRAAARADRSICGHAHGDQEVAVVPGWCKSESDLEATRQHTHDVLIRLLGDRRRSGVTWRTYSVESGALGVAHELGRSGAAEWIQMCNEIRRLLIDQGGFLVVASAEGDRGAA